MIGDALVKKVIDHLWEKPLYENLIQYKILGVVSVIFIGYLIYDLLTWFKMVHETISPAATGAVFAFLGTLIPTFKWALSYVRAKNGENSEEQN
jgi:hypothetical protein